MEQFGTLAKMTNKLIASENCSDQYRVKLHNSVLNLVELLFYNESKWSAERSCIFKGTRVFLKTPSKHCSK